MKRKLVKQGIKALTITLPSSWVKNNNLNPGDEVNLTEVENGLTITTEKKQTKKDITVDVSGLLPRLADRFMARAYQKGYDKIIIKFDDPELMFAVKNKIPELMGFEILNTTRDRIEIEVISTNLELNFDILLRRAMLILQDMGKTCEESWRKGDKKSLENIFYQDYDVNKFTYFCLRELNKSSRIMNFGSSILYYLIESLEDLGDEFKKLGKLLSKLRPDKDILDILKKLNDLFRISYEFFYSPEKKKAIRGYELSKEIDFDIQEAINKKSKDLMQPLMSIEFSNRIISHLITMRLDTLKDLRGE